VPRHRICSDKGKLTPHSLCGPPPPDATFDAEALGAIKMPNRSMFVGDPRPDVKNPA